MPGDSHSNLRYFDSQVAFGELPEDWVFRVQANRCGQQLIVACANCATVNIVKNSFPYIISRKPFKRQDATKGKVRNPKYALHGSPSIKYLREFFKQIPP